MTRDALEVTGELKEIAAFYREEAKRIFVQIENCSLVMADDGEGVTPHTSFPSNPPGVRTALAPPCPVIERFSRLSRKADRLRVVIPPTIALPFNRSRGCRAFSAGRGKEWTHLKPRFVLFPDRSQIA